MAFPHQQARKEHEWKEDKPGRTGVLRKFFKRAIDIAVDRDCDDDVKPAENFTCGAPGHNVQTSFSMPALFKPAQHALQTPEEFLPAVLRALLVGLLAFAYQAG
jgi:hypothetical protein